MFATAVPLANGMGWGIADGEWETGRLGDWRMEAETEAEAEAGKCPELSLAS